MNIKFALKDYKCLKCLETCIYYKSCFQRIEKGGIISDNHEITEWGQIYGCPNFGAIIAPKFEEYSSVSCEDVCHFMTRYNCRHCSASMPLEHCEMMKHGRPTEDCPVYGMPSGEYELEIKDEDLVLVSEVGVDCPKCKNFVDNKCKLYEYDFRDRYCEKLEKIEN